MFKAIMCEVLSNDLSFREFVEQGAQWAKKFEDDLQTYLSGFSFEEVKRKISEDHAQFIDQISKIQGDVTVKVLSLPLSVAVVMILKMQANVGSEWPLILLLLLLVAFPITFLILHYRRVVPRLDQNITMVFDKIKRTDSVAKELDDRVEEVVQSLQIETGKLRTTLRIYLHLAWIVPVISFLFVVCY